MQNSDRSHIRLLIVDDDKAFRVATLALLRDEGYTVKAVRGSEEARRAIVEETFDCIISDLVMEGMNGLELLKYIRETVPDTIVLMVTGFGSVQTAVEAMRLGAYDYITKPCNNDELIIKVSRAVDVHGKSKELARLRSLVEAEVNFSNIVSRNEKMRQVFRLVRQVAETDVTAMVLGETGTGKELVARAIHFNSPRREKPFIAVQCSAIPGSLLESELFGYEKGAFTGAVRQHQGKFEEAEGGTIFLDEIADVPVELQTKLLRIIQEKQFTRLGSNVARTADVRIIAATHRNLEAMVAGGTFREDLFYRLNVFPITLPPLRERLDDIPLLADHLLAKYQSLGRQPITGFAPSVIHDMINYDWKGNVRELENLIKRAIIKTDGSLITSVELPQNLPVNGSREVLETPLTTAMPFKQYLSNLVRDAEQKYLLRMLKECRGNVNQIARMMEVDRKTIYRKLEEYSIDPSAYRD